MYLIECLFNSGGVLNFSSHVVGFSSPYCFLNNEVLPLVTLGGVPLSLRLPRSGNLFLKYSLMSFSMSGKDVKLDTFETGLLMLPLEQGLGGVDVSLDRGSDPLGPGLFG